MVTVFLAPGEGQEWDTEALLEMFRPDSVTVKATFLTPGSGMCVMAAVRQKIPSVVFCGSECHKAVVLEAVLLRIMYAMISGSDNHAGPRVVQRCLGFRVAKRA